MSEINEQQLNLDKTPYKDEVAPVFKTVEVERFNAKHAGFWIRFWAYLIDLVVLSAISGIIIKPILRVAHIQITNPVFLFFSPYKIIMLLVFLLYFALMTKYLQQTIGKMIMGIKVVSQSGGNITWSTILFREIIGRFISKILVIPYLLVLFMPKKEALHDLFADTTVAHENTFEREIQMTYIKPADGQQLHEGTVI